MWNNQELIYLGNFNNWKLAIEKAYLSTGYERMWYSQKALHYQAQYVMAQALSRVSHG